jgi:hypothetical protein
VAAQRVAGTQGWLEVDFRALAEAAECGASERLCDGVEIERSVCNRRDGQTAAVDRHGVTGRSRARRLSCLDPQANTAAVRLRGDDAAELADDPGEHARSVVRHWS